MKLKNKIIPLLTIVTTAGIVSPIATGCSCKVKNYLPTPGWDINYDEAYERVSEWSATTKSGRLIRDNLAESVEFLLSTTSTLSLNGTGISTHYEKKAGDQWIPVTKVTPIQLDIPSGLEINWALKNERAAFSAVDILSFDKKSITAESPTYDRICDFIFNPFLYKTTLADLHTLSQYNPDVFKETFTTTGADAVYVTYDITDIAALLETKEIKELLASDTPCFIPFRGQGSVKLSLGFNNHGYMIYADLTVDSDYLEVYTSPTSGQYPLRPTYYGSAYGSINYESYLRYFTIPKIQVFVDGKDIGDPHDRDPGAPTETQWVNPEENEFAEGLEYLVAFKNQSYKILPGYGATVVVQAPNGTLNVKDVVFNICGKKYTYDELGPNGTGDIVMKSYVNSEYGNAQTYVLYLKSNTYNLCKEDYNQKFVILLSTK